MAGFSVRRTPSVIFSIPVRGIDEGFLRFRIEHPDVADAEGEVLGHFVQHAAHSIFRRKNLNADQWRSREHFLVGLGSGDDAHVGHAIPRLAGAHPPFLATQNCRFRLACAMRNYEPRLNLGVTFSSHVPIQHLPVHVFAVRVIAGPEIFFDRNLGRGRHIDTNTAPAKAIQRFDLLPPIRKRILPRTAAGLQQIRNPPAARQQPLQHRRELVFIALPARPAGSVSAPGPPPLPENSRSGRATARNPPGRARRDTPARRKYRPCSGESVSCQCGPSKM